MYTWYQKLMHLESLVSAACIRLRYAIAAAPLLVAAVGCVDQGLKGVCMSRPV